MAKIKRFSIYDSSALSDAILMVGAEIEDAFIQAGVNELNYSAREILAMAVDLVKPAYLAGQLSVCSSWPDEPLEDVKKPAKWTASTPATNHPTEAPTEPKKLLRIDEVMAVTGFKKSTVYERMKSGGFPKPIHLSRRAVAWREQDVQQWIRSL